MELAEDLVGRFLVVREPGTGISERALIVETEAYGGSNDPASHAAFKPKGRAAIMFSHPGLVYVYAAYGMYPCLNIVAEDDGVPGAVLIRGVWPEAAPKPVLGPGRTTRHLGITLTDHGQWADGPRFCVSARRESHSIERTTRVGIRRGVDLPWRFVVADLSSR